MVADCSEHSESPSGKHLQQIRHSFHNRIDGFCNQFVQGVEMIDALRILFILTLLFIPLLGKFPKLQGTGRKQPRDLQGKFTNKPLRFYGKGDMWTF